MDAEPQMAFAAEVGDPPGLEIRINFGVFAGRDATAAELEELAKLLVPEVGEASIVAEQRHEVSEDVEVSLHQVRVEVQTQQLPANAEERRVMSERLVGLAQTWARSCIADRHADLAEL